MDILKIEKEHLNPLMPTYPNCKEITLRVDKLSTISYLQNHYSVPDYLVLKPVDVKIYIDKLDIFYNDTLVASHHRVNGKNEWKINIMHYTKTLSRKPGALTGSLAFKQMDSTLNEIYEKYFKDEPKGFIELLEIIGNQDLEVIQDTISNLTKKAIPVNIDNIKMIINRNNDPIIEGYNKSNMQKEIEENSKRHLSKYDQIIGTGGLKGDVAI